MNNVSIKSDGTGLGAEVTVGGEIMHGVTLVEFEPITPEGILKVKLTVVDIKLDVTAALVKMHGTDIGWMHSYSGRGFVDPGEQIGFLANGCVGGAIDPVKHSGLSERRHRVVTFAYVWLGPAAGRLMHWLLRPNTGA